MWLYDNVDRQLTDTRVCNCHVANKVNLPQINHPPGPKVRIGFRAATAFWIRILVAVYAELCGEILEVGYLCASLSKGNVPYNKKWADKKRRSLARLNITRTKEY